MDPRLELVSSAIVKAVNALYPETDMDVGENNSVTSLLMWDKRGECKNTEQVQLHRDNDHDNKTGKFCAHNNSQKENTPTCVLTIGMPRNLQFELHKGNFNRKPGDRGTLPVHKPFACTTVPLTHGSLFVLHPEDERSLLREYFDETHLTFWKHGKVYFGKDGLSIGLAFRQTTSTEECKIKTGEVVLSGERKKKAEGKRKPFDKALKKYLEDAEGKREDEGRLQGLYRTLKAKFNF